MSLQYVRAEQRGKETVEAVRKALSHRVIGQPGATFSHSLYKETANCAFLADAKADATLVKVGAIADAMKEVQLRFPDAVTTEAVYDLQARAVTVILNHSPTPVVVGPPAAAAAASAGKAKRKSGGGEDDGPSKKKSKGSSGAPVTQTPLEALAKGCTSLSGAETPIGVKAEVINLDLSEILVTGYQRVSEAAVTEAFEKFAKYIRGRGASPHGEVDLSRRTIRFWALPTVAPPVAAAAAAAAAAALASIPEEKIE